MNLLVLVLVMFLFPVPSPIVCQEVSFSCSLTATGQRFVCPEEPVTYVCSGPGDTIKLSSPPNSRITFERGNNIGTSVFSDSIIAYLISTDAPMMMASVVVVNSSSDQEIGCQVPPAEIRNVSHRMSGPPLDVSSPLITFEGLVSDSNLGVVNVRWERMEGNFDVNHYMVQLYQNGNKIGDPVSVNSLSVVVAVPVDIGDNIHARITTISKCNHESGGILTETVKALSGGGKTVSATLTILVSAVLITFLL